MNVLLRRARPRDVRAMAQLERHFPTDRFSGRALRYLVRARNASVIVAESSLGIVGALFLLVRRGSRVARIYSIVVSPRVRNRGLGAALLEEAEREARRRRRTVMSLEVRAGNRAARALYERSGYRLYQRLPRYYEDGATALRLRKPLD